jgi:hypothetical protein
MSFHYSAENIRVDDNHMLRARLQRADGEWNDSELDLNNCIGNDNGMPSDCCTYAHLLTRHNRLLPLGWPGLRWLRRERLLLH